MQSARPSDAPGMIRHAMGRWDERFTDRQRAALAKGNMARELGGDGLGAPTVVKLAKAGELRDAEGTIEPFDPSLSYVYDLRRREERKRGGEHRAKTVHSPAQTLDELAKRMVASLAAAVDAHDRRSNENRSGKRRMTPAQVAEEVRDLAKAGIEVERLTRALHPQNAGPKVGNPGKGKDAPTSDVARLLAASKRETEGDPSPDTNGAKSGGAAEPEQSATERSEGATADLPSGLAEAGFSAARAERAPARAGHGPSGHTSER